MITAKMISPCTVPRSHTIDVLRITITIFRAECAAIVVVQTINCKKSSVKKKVRSSIIFMIALYNKNLLIVNDMPF